MKKTTFKRITSLALAIILLMGCFPMAAFAEEDPVPETCEVCGTALTGTDEGFVCDVCTAQPEVCEVCGTALTDTDEGFVCDVCTAQPVTCEEPEIITETVTLPIIFDLELPDHEELFAAFVERELYDHDVALSGTTARADLNTVEKAIYDALKAKIEYVALHGGSTEFALDNVPGLKTSWTNKELTLTFDNLFNAFEEQFDHGRIMRALLADCPFDLYWFDKTIGASLGYSGQISSTTGKILNIKMTFYVANAYQGSSDCSVTTNVSKVTTAKATAEQVAADNRSTSDYETLLAFKNYICNAVSYNDAAAENDSTPYGDPWQLIYVFDNNSTTNVVCEGYSKAFQYLCDLAGLDCISVSGTTSGPHMWNVVTLNGEKYLVDVTNSDSGTIGSNGSLFLAGAPYKNGKYTFDCGYGTITYTCDNLGLAASSYNPLNVPHSHNYSAVVTAPTCTENGYTTHTCSGCGDSYIDSETPSTGHSWDEGTVITEPTETTAGLRRYTCGVCFDTKDEAISTTGKAYTIIDDNEYWITEDMTLTENILVAEGTSVYIDEGVTVTVPSGVELNIQGYVEVYGNLTFEDGSILTIADENWRGLCIWTGKLDATGADISGVRDGAVEVQLNSSAEVKGIPNEKLFVTCYAYSTEEVNELLKKASNYEFLLITVDSSFTLKNSITIPDNVEFFVWQWDTDKDLPTLVIPSGITVTNNGWFTLDSGRVVVEQGGKLINNNYAAAYGVLLVLGEFQQNGTFEGTYYESTMSQAELESALEYCVENGYAWVHENETTIYSDMTIDLGEKEFRLSKYGRIIVADGATLTVNSSMNTGTYDYGDLECGQIIVEDGGKLIINGDLQTHGTDHAELILESGSHLVINGRIFANEVIQIGKDAVVEVNGYWFGCAPINNGGTILPAATSISVSVDNSVIDPETTEYVTLNVSVDGGSALNLKRGVILGATWVSSDPDIIDPARIVDNGMGEYRAYLGDKTGKVTLTATYIDGSGKPTANITLHVQGKSVVPEKPYKIANVVSGVHVYWKATEGAEKYGLWRSETGKDGTYKWIANPTVPHFTDTKVESGKTYFYKVTSFAAGNHSEKSEAIGIAYVYTPDITSRVNTAAGVKLGWEKIEGATGYAIYRKAYEDDAWTERIVTISGNETFTWTDTSVKNNNGTAYKYTIRALAGSDMKTLSGCRNAGRSMVRLSSQVLRSATKASATSVKCTWTTSSRVTGYEVRFLVDGEVFKTFTVGNYKTGTKTFTALEPGQTYTVQVRTYKKIDGVGSFYSDWSTAKTVKI